MATDGLDALRGYELTCCVPLHGVGPDLRGGHEWPDAGQGDVPAPRARAERVLEQGA